MISDTLVGIIAGVAYTLGTIFIATKVVDLRLAKLEYTAVQTASKPNTKPSCNTCDAPLGEPDMCEKCYAESVGQPHTKLEYASVNETPEKIQPWTREQILKHNQENDKNLQVTAEFIAFRDKCESGKVTDEDKAEFKEKYPNVYGMFEAGNFKFGKKLIETALD